MASNSVIWKDILGYEGLYQISNCGEVRSIPHFVPVNCHGTMSQKLTPSKILKKQITGRDKNYYKVTLSKQGKSKQFLLHRLIAETFIPNPDKLPQVNHKDENGFNNDISNLEWVTAKENANYGTRNARIYAKRGWGNVK